MEKGNISDAQINASSERITTYPAYQGRLHFAKKGSWVAGTEDANQWLQIDLGSTFTRVTSVATQGGNDRDWWVKEYMLLYSVNDTETPHFQYYREGNNNTVNIVNLILYYYNKITV